MNHADRMFTWGGSTWASGFFPNTVHTFNYKTNTWENNGRWTDYAGVTGCCSYDPNTGLVWIHSSYYLYSYNYNTNTWTRFGRRNLPIDIKSVLDPVNKLFLVLGVIGYSIANPANPVEIGFSGGGGVSSSGAGAVYDTKLNRIVAWSGGPVKMLNTSTRQWTSVSASGAPSFNSLGVFGRWQYSPKHNVHVVVTGVDDNVYFFKASPGGGPAEYWDAAPPSAPTNLRKTGSHPYAITLVWSAPAPASGTGTASSYIIKRNGALAGYAVDTTYTDTGLDENTEYDYEVIARDKTFLKSSALAGPFSTERDAVAPALDKVSAYADPAKVKVVFSKAVDGASAENTANYTISNGIQVNSASLGSDGKTVTLSTSTQSEGTLYALTVNNVKDASVSQNTIASNSTAEYEYSAKLTITIVEYFGSRDEPLIAEDRLFEEARKNVDYTCGMWYKIPK
jgi:hypothetical protein